MAQWLRTPGVNRELPVEEKPARKDKEYVAVPLSVQSWVGAPPGAGPRL